MRAIEPVTARLASRLKPFERKQLRLAAILAGWEEATPRRRKVLEDSMANAYRAQGRTWLRGKKLISVRWAERKEKRA